MTAALDIAPIGPAPRPRRAPSRDFSRVTSIEAAHRLAAQGILHAARLFPPELGGTDHPTNVVYLPGDVAEELGRTAAAVLQQVGRRWASTVDVVPERRGESVVPSRIRIRAGLVSSANALAWTIEVW